MMAAPSSQPHARRPSRIRAYGISHGRTAADQYLSVECQIATIAFDAQRMFRMLPETASIYEACQTETTIAELAAGLALPLGVVRVLVGDLVTKGRVRILPQAVASGQRADPELLQRVINGLAKL